MMIAPMQQGFAVEFFFDPKTEEKILAFRDRVYNQGVNPILGTRNDRPHVSLAVFGLENKEKLIELSRIFAANIQKIQVELETVGIFPSPANVLFLLPIPTRTLLQTHASFHQIVKKEKIPSTKYYLPDRWVPHCTLESELPDSQLDLAVSLCKKEFSPIKGTFNSLGVIAFWPLEYLAEFEIS